MPKIQISKHINSKEILKYDHYVGVATIFTQSNATTEGSKKIVKAGTIVPANDATAKGVVLYDVDVTNGDSAGTLVIHGFIDKSKLPVPVETLAESALPMIKFI